MRIFFNQNLINNFSSLIDDPAIVEARNIWGPEEVYKKSAIELSVFDTPFGSISILYGPRQIGKTSSLKLWASQLQDSDTVIFTDCSTILERRDLATHLASLIEGKTTVILDEVQEVEGWHLALRSLYAEGKLSQCRVWCTGSEARYLLESGERLPGRKGDGKVIFARPWSFREYMHFFHPGKVASYKNISFLHVNQRWLDDQKVEWESEWQTYLMTGGIPHTVGCFIKTGSISDSIWQVYRDWILGSWSKLRTPERSLTGVARRLCETLNSRVSFESIRKGTDILSANTLKTLLEIQEDHFSLVTLARYDPQKNRFLPSKLKKIYPLDPFVAKVWAAIGWNIKRLYVESIPPLPLDECAFAAQMLRHQSGEAPGYLYSDTTKSEIDFYFEGCAFELKSNGNPTSKQAQMLKVCQHAFVVRRKELPLMAYLIGEERKT